LINRNKVKVTHIITGLNTGGAEMMLYKLLSTCDHDRFEMEVISLTDVGEIGKKIQKLGIEVRSLGVNKNVFLFDKIMKLIKWLRDDSPDVLQTWMYHADLLGAIASLFVKDVKLIWNIRNGCINKNRMKRSTIVVAKICAWLSKFIPQKIICCAKATADLHTKFGYKPSKIEVISNGFDMNLFRFDSESYKNIRTELKLPDNSLLVGMMARFDADKDYPNFIEAAKIIASQNLNVYFVCCGKNIDRNNIALIDLIDKLNLQNKFFLLGERNDVPKILPSFDVLVSSSVSEGFSNVIGEAMACEVPCVVTDVGDSATIVGDSDYVVLPRDSVKLAQKVLQVLDTNMTERRKIGKIMRDYIAKKYSIATVVDQYQNLYCELAK
jgi:glycosyltransferase involved in cell wall biosynthesis